MILFLGVLAAGMTQFGILAVVPGTTPLIISAGVVGAMGAALAGLLTKLPQREWSAEERAEKNGG